MSDLAEINLDGVIAGRMAVFNIARREIFVGGILEHAAFEHVNAGDTESLVERLEEMYIIFNVRKRFQDFVIGDISALFPLFDERFSRKRFLRIRL